MKTLLTIVIVLAGMSYAPVRASDDNLEEMEQRIEDIETEQMYQHAAIYQESNLKRQAEEDQAAAKPRPIQRPIKQPIPKCKNFEEFAAAQTTGACK